MTTQPAPPPAPDPTLDPSVFWFRHKNEIIAALAIVVLALAGLAGYWLYKQHRDSAAADALAKAKTPGELQNVTAHYKGTPAGATAYLFLAEQQRNDKKFADANTTLQTFLDKNPKHELAGTARMAMAANLESLGKRDEAFAMYQRVSVGDAHSFNAPFALLAQARLLKEKNQIEEARRVCETILTQYRDSFVAGEATRQLRMLKPAQPAATAVPAAGTTPSTPSSSTASVPAQATPAIAPTLVASPVASQPASPPKP